MTKFTTRASRGLLIEDPAGRVAGPDLGGTVDTWEMLDAERTEFADLCDALTPEQWDTQSLCAKWRVRDGVGHVAQGANLTTGRALVTLARYGFRLGPMLEATAIETGRLPTA